MEFGGGAGYRPRVQTFLKHLQHYLYYTIMLLKSKPFFINTGMGLYKHENMVLDLTCTTKSRLYINNRLIFMGDGYKAINLMINNSKNKEPVRFKFNTQLTMREKPKFTETKEITDASSGDISRNSTRKK